MEDHVFSQAQKQNSHTPRRFLAKGPLRDLWELAREGSVTDIDAALASLKKNGVNVNSRNAFGLTPLHIATWRNHIPIVRRLLLAGADPNSRDGESGWSSLHRALHFGHLAVASALLQCGASITLEDSRLRTPVDLLSGPVLQAVGNKLTTEVLSWGSGVNYQLGTGNAHIQKLPCKLDSLHGVLIKFVSAAKFHSVAVTSHGEVYTWGFGRGGRLGHPDFDIHSGQAAVITPRLVTSGLGARRVKAIAAAKHHTVVATEGGEVFTWGSNREGQLGYTSIDSQPTPRRVSSLKSKVVAVAAANKHTAVVSDVGEVFTWGCNKQGQLGYGTSNSASNYTPRVVEYLKGKVLIAVVAAKCHTIVLGADGEVFTWGHKLVNPRRVIISRNIKKGGNTTLKFHRKEKPHVVSITAGMVYSMALTDDGALFYWLSSDPDLRCLQLHLFSAQPIASISAGKYWAAAVTVTGDVYMWDGKQKSDETPVVTRLHGAKRATSVSVGETHLLMISSLYHSAYPSIVNYDVKDLKVKFRGEMDELDENFLLNDSQYEEASSTTQKNDNETRHVPSLKSLCEKVAAESLVEPRNAIQLLEIADSLEAYDLRKYCEDIVIRNLDYILTVSTHAVASASLDILANLENFWDLKSSESWSYRRLPTATATIPVIINSEEDCESDSLKSRTNHEQSIASKKEIGRISDGFLKPYDDESQSVCKQVRALRKKLQQIEMLEEKQIKGHLLDDQQVAKLQMKALLKHSLAELDVPVEILPTAAASLMVPDRVSKRVEASRKQRRKSKLKARLSEEVPSCNEIVFEANSVKGFLNVEASQVNEESDAIAERFKLKQGNANSFTCSTIESKDIPKTKSSCSTKKKKNRKGGLSLFLSGALEDAPKDVEPPPPLMEKYEGPAWGGAGIPKMPSSLREIQNEQSKIKECKPTLTKEQLAQHSEVKNHGKLRLGSFLASNPIPVASALTMQSSDGDKSTPPWAASRTPPSLSCPSLRDIQLQQGKSHQGPHPHSPKTRTTGFSVANGQGSPSDHGIPNRWFKPELEPASAIRSIQIEERAIKDLKRFYSSVKVVTKRS